MAARSRICVQSCGHYSVRPRRSREGARKVLRPSPEVARGRNDRQQREADQFDEVSRTVVRFDPAGLASVFALRLAAVTSEFVPLFNRSDLSHCGRPLQPGRDLTFDLLDSISVESFDLGVPAWMRSCMTASATTTPIMTMVRRFLLLQSQLTSDPLQLTSRPSGTPKLIFVGNRRSFTSRRLDLSVGAVPSCSSRCDPLPF